MSFCPNVAWAFAQRSVSMSHPLSCPKKALADIFEHNGWVNCHLAIMLLSCPAFSWTTDVVAIASRPMSISKNQFVLPLLCTVLYCSIDKENVQELSSFHMAVTLSNCHFGHHGIKRQFANGIEWMTTMADWRINQVNWLQSSFWRTAKSKSDSL